MTPMERQITRNMLREAVGRQMTCPGCKQILDCRRAVELDFYHRGGRDIAGVKVMCAPCYDAKCGHGKLRAQMEGTGFTVEAIDGRELFGGKR